MGTAPSPSPWSTLAASYEDLFPLRPARLDLVLSLAPPGARVLDAGCATGSLPRALAERGRLAHGLDLEPAFLEVARARAGALDIRWHQAGLLDLAAATEGFRFDLVTCLGQTLPHLLEDSEWVEFFRQVRARLAPGGRLLVQVVNDAGRPAGNRRDLPLLHAPGGSLQRSRTLLSDTLAEFETVFEPIEGPPVTSRVRHRRMQPGPAQDLLAKAGLATDGLWADESRVPFRMDSPAWLLEASSREG